MMLGECKKAPIVLGRVDVELRHLPFELRKDGALMVRIIEPTAGPRAPDLRNEVERCGRVPAKDPRRRGASVAEVDEGAPLFRAFARPNGGIPVCHVTLPSSASGRRRPRS